MSLDKLNKIKGFEARTYKLSDELTSLIDDMTAYTASCHQARIMLKRYNKLVRMSLELSGSLTAACNEMRKTDNCIWGEL